MNTLTRRNISAIAKLDLAGLKHAQRIDAIAKALGYKTGESLMGALSANEAPATTDKPIREIHAWGADAVNSVEEDEPFGSGYVSERKFNTVAEYRAYCSGLEAASGWHEDQMIIDTQDHPQHPYFQLPERCKNVSFTDWWNAPYLYVQVEGTPSEEEDKEIPGTYVFKFSPSDESLTQSTLAGSTLDAFHDSHTIRCLDDFDISVFDHWGNEYGQEEDYKNYSHVHDVGFDWSDRTGRAELMEHLANNIPQ